MSKTAREAARRLLEMEIPPEKVADMCELSGILVTSGATYGDLLEAKLLSMAQNGDKKAAELVQRYVLQPKGCDPQ